MGSHLIQTQIIVANFQNKESALNGQELLQDRYNNVLIPVLEQVLDEYDPISRSLRIEKLELDLGRIPVDLPIDLIRDRFRDALEDQLRKVYVEHGLNFSPSSKSLLPKRNSSGKTSKNSSNWELLEYFLHFGRYPWWASKTESFNVRDLVRSIFTGQKSILDSWLEKKTLTYTMAQRLAAILTEKQAEVLIQSNSKVQEYLPKTRTLELILNQLILSGKIGKAELHFRFKSIVLYSFFGKRSEFSTYLQHGFSLIFKQNPKLAPEATLFICELAIILDQRAVEQAKSFQVFHKDLITVRNDPKLAQLVSGDKFWKAIFSELEILKDQNQDLNTFSELLKKSKKRENDELQSKAPELDEVIIVSNAGLVLTAAFLPKFFENLGLVKAGLFISDQTQSKAVYMLQALLGSVDTFDESDLTLNKLLCGIPLAAALEPIIKISKSERREIDSLLESMATQWTALKSSSGKMIAEGFFRREGSLRKVQKGYKLQIQRLPFDILLDRLPWTIGIIKLPWMEEIISVEW